jgi:predicted RNA-binding Zn ribbon-like protein
MVVMDELADQYPALNGGALCLDFANTLEPLAAGGADRDHLGSDQRTLDAEGLLAWLRYAQVIDEHQAETLTVDAVRDARRLRSAITAVFTAVAHGTTPGGSEVDVLRKAYARAISGARLEPGATRWEWEWTPARDPLAPIAASAVELLTGPDIGRVKQCAGERCWVLFVDTTRNGSRRWCQMRYCGNVLKSRRQSAHRRAARAASKSRGQHE